ncbi:MAG: hypothetical protein V4529_17345 [Gemmatimonadota bacterium]
MTAHTLLSLYLVAAALAVVSRADGAGPTIQTRTAQTIVATWRCEDKLPRARTFARSPWKPHSTGFRVAELARWQHRLTACRAVLKRRAYEWAWKEWLPDNWAKLGACETGYGQRPGNWFHHNALYVSAFGISRREYDADAAYFGAPPWNDTKPPSPYNQYLAAKGHYARFGDGWGCPGP